MKKSDKFYDIFSYFLLRFFFSSVAYCPLLLPSVFAQNRRFFVGKSLNGSGGNRMLCIKKSRRNGEYIVYNPHHFQLHTHTKHKRIALQCGTSPCSPLYGLANVGKPYPFNFKQKLPAQIGRTPHRTFGP